MLRSSHCLQSFVACLALGILMACGDATDASPPAAAHKAASTAAKQKRISADAGTPAETGPIDVFDPSKARTYAFHVDPADWDLINRFPVKEQYIQGTLDYAGRTFGPIALRYKGARGSLYGCFKCCSTSDTLANCPGPDQACYDDNGMIAPNTCPKLSMKVDFHTDWGNTDFYGIDRLNIHAPQVDNTEGLRERLAYWMFNDFGVIAPRTASASVTVNGQKLGMFTIVEAPSSSFATQQFGDDEPGNLYKQRWPTLSTEPDYYASGLENHKNGDVSTMVQLAEALATASDETIAGILRQRVDVDSLMRYLAVDRAIGNFDGPLTFRCKDHTTIIALPDDVLAAQVFPLPWETCQNKNFYLYERPSDHRIVLVPWDLNLTIFPFPFMLDWTTKPMACDMMQWDGRTPECDPLVRWLATVMYPDYLQAAQQLLTSSLDLDRVNAQLDAWAEVVRPAALAAEPSLSQPTFDNGLSQIKSSIATLRDDFAQSVGIGP